MDLLILFNKIDLANAYLKSMAFRLFVNEIKVITLL
jgi:hypothetical protein